MNAEIISIGDELLNGHNNSNAAWISSILNDNGISVKRIYTVSDNKKDIISCLENALKNSDIVFSTGGLGPTKDDITKEALCKFFKCNLKFSDSAYNNIVKLFKTLGQNVSHSNKKQAEIPDISKPIPNIRGTAPGLWFDIDKKKAFIAMPGVPYEMETMFENFIIPELKNRYQLPYIITKTVLTAGIAESHLSELLIEWEKHIPKFIKLAYLPSPGIVKLCLTGKGENKEEIENTIDVSINELKKLIPQYIYGYDEQKLEEIIGALLREREQSLSVAESCTGGFISHTITSCPGSSEYFNGSIIAYSNNIKTKHLLVPETLIQEHGAVSEAVVKMMAENVRQELSSTYGIATTGIAGPSGGRQDKPVGTVWIAVATPKKTIAEKFLFGENRILNITRATLTALNMLRKEITG